LFINRGIAEYGDVRVLLSEIQQDIDDDGNQIGYR